MLKLSQKPGFLDLRGESETGFLPRILARMPKLSEKPGFLDLGSLRGGSETGFFPRILARMLKLSQKPGFLDVLDLLTAANPSHIASVFFKRSRQRIITA
jgi:heme-degrading monooxygenase HmoA